LAAHNVHTMNTFYFQKCRCRALFHVSASCFSLQLLYWLKFKATFVKLKKKIKLKFQTYWLGKYFKIGIYHKSALRCYGAWHTYVEISQNFAINHMLYYYYTQTRLTWKPEWKKNFSCVVKMRCAIIKYNNVADGRLCPFNQYE